MNKKELEERIKILDQRLVNLDAKFMGQIAGLKDKHLLTNDRIDDAFFIIRELDRKQIKDAE